MSGTHTAASGGPLAGVKVLEVGGIGAGPFCAMMLADMGAEVVRIERHRAAADAPPELDPLLRSRRSVTLDLKAPGEVQKLLRLAARADVLLEAYRPGVAERLGFGPEVCLERNPRLVYGRMTGWGQSGPLAQAAGHDINYIALSGLLHLIGVRGGKPVPPLNVVGDFGGGGLLLAFGVVCALLEAQRSGRGQVIDAAMLDGAASFLGMFFGFRARRGSSERPGEEPLAGAAHYYDTYETQDGRYIAIAPIEPQFYAELVERLGLDRQRFGSAGYPHEDAHTRELVWPQLKAQLAALFRTRTRTQWCELLEGTDVCFAPVLTPSEAPGHPHNAARGTFTSVAGVVQAAPAPRFSRTAAPAPQPPRRAGEDTEQVLRDWGVQ